jgi:hypothetical protein
MLPEVLRLLAHVDKPTPDRGATISNFADLSARGHPRPDLGPTNALESGPADAVKKTGRA